jgi:vacuolar-type H+-ATPase subunit I/STV1
MPTYRQEKEFGMTDQTQANSKAEQPQVPMPSTEQSQTSQVRGDETVPQGEVPTIEGDKFELPEGAKERTAEQFEKLKEQLREEREKRLSYEKRFVQTPTQQIPVPTQKLYNPETGEVNIDALESLQTRLARAESELSQTARNVRETEEQRQEREAFESYPELDPRGDKFNGELHKTTRALLLDSMLNPADYGSQQLTFKQAATLAKQYSGGTIKQVKEEAHREAVEGLSATEQASLEATGRSDRRTGGDMATLQLQTRKGDIDAITRRLRSIK